MQFAIRQLALFCLWLAFLGNSEAWAKTNYTLPELLGKTLEKNYAIRINAEKVYRARQQVSIAIARLVPTLNFGTVLSAIQLDYFDLVPSLLGFLFPSNWFRWQESTLYFQAEKKTYQVLIANELNAVESLAYRIHSIISLASIYDLYLQKLEELLTIAELRRDMGEDPADVHLALSNIVLKMKHDLASLQASLAKMGSDMAFAIGLGGEDSWDDFAIAPITLPDLSEASELDANLVYSDVLQKAQEKKALEFLTLGAKYSLFTRAFSFLSPSAGTDAGFGFGYPASIKIGKSAERELHIKMTELDANLKTAARKAVFDYNLAINLFQKSQLGLANSIRLLGLLETKFVEGGVFELAAFRSAVESLLAFHSRLLQAQHQFLISKAQIDRLTWQGPYYGKVLALEQKTLKSAGEETLFDVQRWLQFFQRKGEDMLISHDLAHFKLVWPGP